jgi:DNA-binding response OmpR family regulator
MTGNPYVKRRASRPGRTTVHIPALWLVGPVEEDGGSPAPFAGFAARIHRLKGWRDAVRSASSIPPRVIVCERRLPDGDWRDVLGLALDLPHPPTVIVTCRQADEHLWAEVLNLGGYDVLAKPFDEREVGRSLTLAWERWAAHSPEQGVGICLTA